MAQTYKCPGCGAKIEFDSESQVLKCEYCGTRLTVEEAKNCVVNEEPEMNYTDSEGNFDVYRCSNCGAELLTDENTSATFCSFCGNPSLIKDRLSGEKTPAALIPFKINKEKAIQMYKDWTKKGLLTPSTFRSQASIEKITGIYVPFWLYDYDARINVHAVATRVRTETKGEYRYTHTDHFDIVRDLESEYRKIPADAAEKMPDDMMDKLEPFSYSDLTQFEMPYLSGYVSEKYNYTSDEMRERAEKRVREYIHDTAMKTIAGYSTVNVINEDTNLKGENAVYTLFPVWMLNYSYKGEQFMFAINGQTGKKVGKLPISKGKLAAWFGGITAASFAIIMLMGGIFG